MSRFVDVRREEAGVLLASALGFFCVLASAFVLRPIRDEIGIARGAENLPWMWTGTLAVTLLVTPLFALLVSRYPRRTFLPFTYRFFAANLVVFMLLSRTLHGDALEWMRKGFYFWFSTFNVFVVSVWWGFVADLFRLEQSRRLFGSIAVGGTLGALFGAWFTRSTVDRLGSLGIMLCSVVLLEAAAQVARRLARRIEPNAEGSAAASSSPEHRRGAEDSAKLGTAWSGMQRVIASPYMRAIAIYVLLQTLVAAFLSFEVNKLVEEGKSTAIARTVAFAQRDMWTQGMTLLFQVFLTGRLLPRLGVSATLVIQPFIAIGGMTLLAWALPEAPEPGSGFPADQARLSFALTTVVIFEAIFRATQHGFSRPARSTLFTVVDREEKYKSQSFIDTFVWRGGDTLFVWAFRGLCIDAALPAALVAGMVVPFAGLWLVLSWFLGRTQRRLAGERD